MKIAIITGASAGLGREFLRQAPAFFPEVEEYWLIARRLEKLEEVSRLITKPCRLLSLDLTCAESYDRLASVLAAEKPEVALLVNNSGCGYLGNVGEGALSRQLGMIQLNLEGLTAVTHLSIPYMTKGSRIVNVSSIASFCPNPRMTVYSATKAYVSAFTGGIAYELAPRGIRATAVCPGPMDTDFLTAGGIRGNSKTFAALPYCDPVRVVRGTYRAALRGRRFYTPRLFYKFYRVLAKLLPAGLLMHVSKT